MHEFTLLNDGTLADVLFFVCERRLRIFNENENKTGNWVTQCRGIFADVTVYILPYYGMTLHTRGFMLDISDFSSN